MRKKLISVLLLLTFAGLIISGLLVKQHLHVLEKGFDEKSFCNIGEWANCDAVNASSYSEVFGIPVAAFGFALYLLIAVFLIAGLFSRPDNKASLTFAWILSLVSVAASAAMAYISLVIIGAVCLYCVSLYVINLLLFILSPFSLNLKISEWGTYMKNYFKAIFGKSTPLTFKPVFFRNTLISVVVMAVTSIVWVGQTQSASKKGPSEEEVAFYFKRFFSQPAKAINTDGRPSWGNPDAKIKIVEFSDFQCPFCRIAAVNLKPSLLEYKKDVQIVFMNYPLDMKCNPAITHPFHENSCNAAKAAYCGGQKGLFWQYHDVLFDNQKKLSMEDILQYGQDLGLDVDQLKSCINSPATLAAIQKDTTEGQKLELEGTPSVFLNGRLFGPWRDTKILRRAINEELKNLSKK